MGVRCAQPIIQLKEILNTVKRAELKAGVLEIESFQKSWENICSGFVVNYTAKFKITSSQSIDNNEKWFFSEVDVSRVSQSEHSVERIAHHEGLNLRDWACCDVGETP